MKTIKVDIDIHGNTVIKVEGVKGESCKDLTKGLEKALGTVSKDTPTSEMHEQEATNHVDVGR